MVLKIDDKINLVKTLVAEKIVTYEVVTFLNSKNS